MIAENLVSIITPMYKGAEYVGKTIESVLGQTYGEWEMIIVDDCSPDGGKGIELVKTYMRRDNRIRLIESGVNRGSSGARNLALQEARGRYVCFLDADDLWDECFLEKQLAFLQKGERALVFGSYRRIDREGKGTMRPFIVPEKVGYNDLLKTCSISCLTAMYDRTKTGDLFFNEELRSLRDDFAFWLSMLKRVGWAWGNPEVLASYRVFSASTTGNKRKVMKPQFMVYYKIERLGLLRSLYYFVYWAINGFFKYK